MEKTIEVEGKEIILATLSLQKYWDLMDLEKRLKDKLATQKSMILHSIVSWNIVDEKGEPAAITIENIGKYLGVNFLTPIDDALKELNDLREPEKKILSAPSADV